MWDIVVKKLETADRSMPLIIIILWIYDDDDDDCDGNYDNGDDADEADRSMARSSLHS